MLIKTDTKNGKTVDYTLSDRTTFLFQCNYHNLNMISFYGYYAKDMSQPNDFTVAIFNVKPKERQH